MIPMIWWYDEPVMGYRSRDREIPRPKPIIANARVKTCNEAWRTTAREDGRR